MPLKRDYLSKISACEGFHYDIDGTTYGMPYQPLPIVDPPGWTPGIRECHKRYDLILKHLPTNRDSVLDIGINHGYNAGRLVTEGVFAHGAGIDANPVTIEHCQATWPMIPVLKAMFDSKEARETYTSGWDLILALAVTDYVGDKSVFLSLCCDGLNPHGKMIIEGHSMDLNNGHDVIFDEIVRHLPWQVERLEELTDVGINAPKEAMGRPVWICSRD